MRDGTNNRKYAQGQRRTSTKNDLFGDLGSYQHKRNSDYDQHAEWETASENWDAAQANYQSKKQRYWQKISPLHKFFTAIFSFVGVSLLGFGLLRTSSAIPLLLAEKIAIDFLLAGFILVGLVTIIAMLISRLPTRKTQPNMPKDAIATIALGIVLVAAATITFILFGGDILFGTHMYSVLANITIGFPFEPLMIAGSVVTLITLLAHGLHSLNPKNIFSTVNKKAAAVIVFTALAIGGVGAILAGVFNAPLGLGIAPLVNGAATLTGGWLTAVGIAALVVGFLATLVVIGRMKPVARKEDDPLYFSTARGDDEAFPLLSPPREAKKSTFRPTADTSAAPKAKATPPPPLPPRRPKPKLVVATADAPARRNASAAPKAKAAPPVLPPRRVAAVPAAKASPPIPPRSAGASAKAPGQPGVFGSGHDGKAAGSAANQTRGSVVTVRQSGHD